MKFSTSYLAAAVAATGMLYSFSTVDAKTLTWHGDTTDFKHPFNWRNEQGQNASPSFGDILNIHRTSSAQDNPIYNKSDDWFITSNGEINVWGGWSHLKFTDSAYFDVYRGSLNVRDSAGLTVESSLYVGYNNQNSSASAYFSDGALVNVTDNILIGTATNSQTRGEMIIRDEDTVVNANTISVGIDERTDISSGASSGELYIYDGSEVTTTYFNAAKNASAIMEMNGGYFLTDYVKIGDDLGVTNSSASFVFDAAENAYIKSKSFKAHTNSDVTISLDSGASLNTADLLLGGTSHSASSEINIGKNSSVNINQAKALNTESRTIRLDNTTLNINGGSFNIDTSNPNKIYIADHANSNTTINITNGGSFKDTSSAERSTYTVGYLNNNTTINVSGINSEFKTTSKQSFTVKGSNSTTNINVSDKGKFWTHKIVSTISGENSHLGLNSTGYLSDIWVGDLVDQATEKSSHLNVNIEKGAKGTILDMNLRSGATINVDGFYKTGTMYIGSKLSSHDVVIEGQNNHINVNNRGLFLLDNLKMRASSLESNPMDSTINVSDAFTLMKVDEVTNLSADGDFRFNVTNGATFETGTLIINDKAGLYAAHTYLTVSDNANFIVHDKMRVNERLGHNAFIKVKNNASINASDAEIELGYSEGSYTELALENGGSLNAYSLTFGYRPTASNDVASTTKLVMSDYSTLNTPLLTLGANAGSFVGNISDSTINSNSLNLGFKGKASLNLDNSTVSLESNMLVGIYDHSQTSLIADNQTTITADRLVLGRNSATDSDYANFTLQGHSNLKIRELSLLNHGTFNLNSGHIKFKELNLSSDAQFSWASGIVEYAPDNDWNDTTLTNGSDLHKILGEDLTLTAGQIFAIHDNLILGTKLTLDGGALLVENLNASVSNSQFQFKSGHLAFKNGANVDEYSILGSYLQLTPDKEISARQTFYNAGFITGSGTISDRMPFMLDDESGGYGGGYSNSTFSNAGEAVINLSNHERLFVKMDVLENYGSIELFDSQLIARGDLVNYGLISGSNTYVRAGLKLKNYGKIQFAGTSHRIYSDVETFANSTIKLAHEAELAIHGDLKNNGEINITDDAALVVFETLSGSGTFTGEGRVYAYGKLAPGNSPGALNVEGDLILEDTTKTEIELAGYVAGGSYDQINVNGEMQFDGELKLILLDGFMVDAGDEFQIFNASTYTGEFDQFVAPQLSSGLSWDTTTLNTDGMLRVIPEPTSLLLLGVGGLLVLNRRRA